MESLPDPAAFLTRWNSVLSREAELCWSLPTVTLLHLMGLVVTADSSDPWRPTRFHLVILSEHDRLCVGSPRPGLVLKDPGIVTTKKPDFSVVAFSQSVRGSKTLTRIIEFFVHSRVLPRKP